MTTAQPVRPTRRTTKAPTQDTVAAALPASAQANFAREVSQAHPQEIGQVLIRWWLLAQVRADPLTAQTAAAVKAGIAPGSPATAALRTWRRAD